MNRDRFDTLARLLGQDVTRRSALLAAALTGSGLARSGETWAKKKKKKKRCRSVTQACANSKKARCCSSLSCGDNGCAEGNVCFKGSGGSCRDSCDCSANLQCDERAGFTCGQCSFPQEACQSDGDCCLNTSDCGDNGCDLDPVCAQEVGAICFDDCDCVSTALCDDNGCDSVAVCCQDEGEFCVDDCDCCIEFECSGNECVSILREGQTASRGRVASEIADRGPSGPGWRRGFSKRSRSRLNSR